MHWMMKKTVLLLVLLASATGIRAGLIDGPAGSQKKITNASPKPITMAIAPITAKTANRNNNTFILILMTI